MRVWVQFLLLIRPQQVKPRGVSTVNQSDTEFVFAKKRSNFRRAKGVGSSGKGVKKVNSLFASSLS